MDDPESLQSTVSLLYFKALIEFFRFLLDKDDKQLLWSKRAYLTKNPYALALVLISAFSWDAISVANNYALLDVWAELSPEDALELLLL
jgi:hypothetical protein